MKDSYPIAQAWTAGYEGGRVDHPDDPGGRTNRGITQRTYDAWRRARGLDPRDVWQIEDHEVAAIYRSQYWDAIRGDELPAGIDAALYDFAVHSGPAQAARTLQRILGTAADGIVGAITLAACRDAEPVQVITRLCEDRLAFCRRLPAWSTFGRGWTRRIIGETPGAQPGTDTGILDRAVALSRGRVLVPPPAFAPGRAPETDDPDARLIALFTEFLTWKKEAV